jgi:Family of unknown function (DUF5662)
MKLRAHWRYAGYVWRHKVFVFRAARRLGVPWLGLLHDWSKLLPDEWFPYVESFYGGPFLDGSWGGKNQRPKAVADAFDRAYLAHVHRNKHHPYAWVAYVNPLPQRTAALAPGVERPMATYTTLPMPERYVREMLADWEGARLAGSDGAKGSTREWYAERGASLPLHAETRVLVERLLAELDGGSA